MTTAQMRSALSLALKYIERSDNAEAIALLRDIAERLRGDGWKELALEVQLVAAELERERVAAALQHWYWCWGYVAALQRQR
jgi:hypothetical protein